MFFLIPFLTVLFLIMWPFSNVDFNFINIFFTILFFSSCLRFCHINHYFLESALDCYSFNSNEIYKCCCYTDLFLFSPFGGITVVHNISVNFTNTAISVIIIVLVILSPIQLCYYLSLLCYFLKYNIHILHFYML